MYNTAQSSRGRMWNIGVTSRLKTSLSTQIHFENRMSQIGLGSDKYIVSVLMGELIREGKHLDSF